MFGTGGSANRWTNVARDHDRTIRKLPIVVGGIGTKNAAGDFSGG
jgi:hypothetical protein